MEFQVGKRPMPIVLSVENYSSIDIPSVISDMDLMKMFPSPPETASQTSSSVGEYSPQSEAMSPDVMEDYGYGREPHLVITEQPIDKFRFRYKSEMAGTHGCLNGRNSDKTRLITFPTVELRNFNGQAVIRCTLYTVDDYNRSLHPHRLMREDGIDPHDLEVGPELGYEAIFSNMGIIHTAKKYIREELTKKLERTEKQKKRLKATDKLNTHDLTKIRTKADEISKKVNLNTVCLGFAAFELLRDGTSGNQICDTVFSDPINNSKSAMTGELKICRMDKVVSSCAGGEEIFMFVEKVMKNNIRVRFYELDSSGEQTIWEEDGKFNPLDVHHQYAIALRTPKYKDINIKTNVTVYVELWRPSDGDRSEPRQFTYRPEVKAGSKRRRIEPTPISEINGLTSLEDGLATRNTIAQISDGIDSEEFKKFESMINMDSYCSTFNSPTSLNSFDLPGDDAHLEVDCLPTGSNGIPYNNIKQSDSDGIYVSGASKPEIAVSFTDRIKRRARKYFQMKPSNESGVIKTLQEVNKDGDTIYHKAIDNENINTISFCKAILRNCPRKAQVINCVNTSHETVLHRAVAVGLVKEVAWLIQHGGNPNLINGAGDTVFHVALNSKHSPMITCQLMEELVKTRLEINLDMEDSAGSMPLHYAVKLNNLGVVKILINAGVNVNQICQTAGNSPLHMAVQQNNVGIARKLLECRMINVNQQNYAGYTPLHIAVVEQNKEMCSLLREYDADPYIKNHEAQIEIKEELDDYIDEEEEDGIDSVQLALHNPDILSILKTEVVDSPEDLMADIEIKEEAVDFDDDYISRLADICDSEKLYKLLAAELGCEDLLFMYQSSPSPTKALLHHQMTKHSIENIKTCLSKLGSEQIKLILLNLELGLH